MTIKKRMLGEACVVLASQACEHASRSEVVRPDSRFDMRDVGQLGPLQQVIEHGASQSLAPRARVHSDLPDEEHIGLIGGHIARDEAINALISSCDHTRLGEMLGQEQVGIDGIEIQRRAILDELVNGSSVTIDGLAQLAVVGGGVLGHFGSTQGLGNIWERVCFFVQTAKPDSGGTRPSGTSNNGEPSSSAASTGATPSDSIRSTMRSRDKVIVACSSSGRAFNASSSFF